MWRDVVAGRGRRDVPLPQAYTTQRLLGQLLIPDPQPSSQLVPPAIFLGSGAALASIGARVKLLVWPIA